MQYTENTTIFKIPSEVTSVMLDIVGASLSKQM